MKDDFSYLKHVLEAIKNIEDYLKGFDFETFSEDKKTVSAVVRELEVIGEATNNLSESFRKDNHEIPFLDIIGMRNRLIHEYFGVNKKIVWETCQLDLKDLKKIILPLIEK